MAARQSLTSLLGSSCDITFLGESRNMKEPKCLSEVDDYETRPMVTELKKRWIFTKTFLRKFSLDADSWMLITHAKLQRKSWARKYISIAFKEKPKASLKQRWTEIKLYCWDCHGQKHLTRGIQSPALKTKEGHIFSMGIIDVSPLSLFSASSFFLQTPTGHSMVAEIIVNFRLQFVPFL